MADTALLSVIFTGTVGVFGAATAIAGHAVSLRNEDRKRAEARREDLRSVLDDAARAATELDQTFDEEETVDDLLKHFGALRGRLPALLGRIGVRLGPGSPEYVAYEQFIKAIAGVETAFAEVPRATFLSAEGLRGLVDTFDQDTGEALAATLQSALTESRAALSRFLVAAHARVGVDV